ncbi:hypothetical protein ABZ543_13075 [Streptomyces roseifaciens]
MIRSRFRFENWTTTQDPETSTEYVVICRSAVRKDGPPCGWEFSVLDDKDAAEEAQRAHVEETQHRHFWEHTRLPTVVTAPPGSLVAARIARRERAMQ